MSKEKWKSVCFKISEKSANTTLENGFSRKQKLNPSLPSLYILVFAQIKAIVFLQDLEKTLQRCECEIGEFEWVSAGFGGGGTHKGHDAHTTCLQFRFPKGAMHTQHTAHRALRTTHTARGQKTLPNHSKFWWRLSNQEVGLMTTLLHQILSMIWCL